MPKLSTLLPALALALSTAAGHAQMTPLNDPANLAGERVSPQDPADTLPLNHGAPALQQLLAKLRTRASLMLIVAHPDDEDGGLLTYESRGQGARVAMLTLTRGEGGQNLMSADFDDALGLIRTQELLAADRYFGVDQFFGTEVDFGFSKTKEESFLKWTHDRVLYDAVRAVRLYRPLVIASVFVGGPTDGHGQHQVAGEIAQEVFVAAADPNVFPEMIAEGLLPWAPLKVYARVPFSRVTPEGMYDYATGKTVPTRFHNYVTGEDSTAVPTATVLIHEGDKPTDPTLAAAMGGDSYIQFARKGLALQKTQIGPNARLAPAGAFDAPYTLMASRLGCIDTKAGCPIPSDSGKGGFSASKLTTEQSLFDGIDTSLPGLATVVAQNSSIDVRATLEAIVKDIATAQKLFDPNKTETAAAPLKSALKKLDELLDMIASSPSSRKLSQSSVEHELRLKRVQLNDALVLALGLTMNAELASGNPEPIVDTGYVVGFSADITHSTLLPITVLGAQVNSSLINVINDKTKLDVIKPPKPISKESLNQARVNAGEDNRVTYFIGAALPTGTPPTKPYFSRPGIEQPFYTITQPALRNAPATPHPLYIAASLVFDSLPLQMRATVTSQTTHTPVERVPDLSVSMAPRVGLAQARSSQNEQVHLTVSTHVNNRFKEGEIKLAMPDHWLSEPAALKLGFTSEHANKQAAFEVKPADLRLGQSYVTAAQVTIAGKSYGEGYRPVGYPGLPYTNFYTPATYRATAVDLHTAPNLHIAYLPGTGDPVPDFLPNLGIIPTILTVKDLTPATLNRYDAVLLGVRAYAAHPELAGPGSQPLLDYAKQGGFVILQYNTARFGDAEAPFPIDVPGDPAHNVVEEAQPVTLLHPDAPLLTWPNKITPADFDGWVAERGHGFAATWSPSYTPLLETHDVGQDPQQGGLLLARTGKGAYIYCALALYRQLPEGVPGAYRLLANLLSLAKNPGFQAH